MINFVAFMKFWRNENGGSKPPFGNLDVLQTSNVEMTFRFVSQTKYLCTFSPFSKFHHCHGFDCLGVIEAPSRHKRREKTGLNGVNAI